MKTKTHRFKKGELTAEALQVLLYDLGCLNMPKTKDNEYHFDLLTNNLIDIFGKENAKKVLKEMEKEK